MRLVCLAHERRTESRTAGADLVAVPASGAPASSGRIRYSPSSRAATPRVAPPGVATPRRYASQSRISPTAHSAGSNGSATRASGRGPTSCPAGLNSASASFAPPPFARCPSGGSVVAAGTDRPASARALSTAGCFRDVLASSGRCPWRASAIDRLARPHGPVRRRGLASPTGDNTQKTPDNAERVLSSAFCLVMGIGRATRRPERVLASPICHWFRALPVRLVFFCLTLLKMLPWIREN